jgi:hypothetical protein
MFIDRNMIKGCNHPEHAPPSHIHVPEDKVYIHECPQCGNVTRMISPNIVLDLNNIQPDVNPYE